ncbi:MAG: hypothetical protein C0467_01285 [Planctomycetaceae bacterium]|nr:hypothetical protein [Planctomycetaceae bacterium]
MNLTVTNAPSVAERVRAALDNRTLVVGQPFYAAGTDVVVVVAPIPAEEAVTSGGDHELTVSTGFPPDPGTAGMTVWVQRRGEAGGQLERLGETDRFGSLVFEAGSRGCEYQLTVTRSSTVRLPEHVAPILPFPILTHPELAGATCPVCRASGWAAKLSGLRRGLEQGSPVCRGHLSGPDGVILEAARDGWFCKSSEVFAACGRLLSDLLDEHGTVRKGFLSLYPVDRHTQALNQVAGVLSTVIAVGHTLSKNPGRAAAAGRAAAVHLDATGNSHLPMAAEVMAEAAHPLEGLFSGLADRLGESLPRGLREFRRLATTITRESSGSM